MYKTTRVTKEGYYSASLSAALEQQDPVWYQTLTAHLTEDQGKEVQEVFKLAEQRRAAAGMYSRDE